MDNDVLLPVVLLGGLATYATRFLPLAVAERLKGRHMPRRLHRFLVALGPAAIAALLALSLAEQLPVDHFVSAGWPVLSGVAAVIAAHRLGGGNPAWATLAGAAAYGLTAVVMGT